MQLQSRTITIISIVLSLFLSYSAVSTAGQGGLPEPGPARSVKVPAVKETKLKNGLTVAVVEKPGVPIVTVSLLVKNGGSSEGLKKAGLANLTAALLTKGTKTRTATQVAEEIEFLGANIFSNAGWQNSGVGLSVTTDKFDPAMTILSDVVLNPTFVESELELERSQALDGLTYNMTQPGFLANYVASRYSYEEHPVGGTPASLRAITRKDIVDFYSKNYRPDESVIIFVGDITSAKAVQAAEKYFGSWKVNDPDRSGAGMGVGRSTGTPQGIFRRLLVVDLPNSGQASVNYLLPLRTVGRTGKDYYTASVLNSLLGGGYSSRLNQEIRIKRGLSYGAGSSFGWRGATSNFGARTQTKNESAAEVAELIMAEIKRLAETDPTAVELDPRKAVLTGGFGRNLETSQGLAAAVGDLYSFGIPTTELNAYMKNVEGVPNSALKAFASKNFINGDLVIVGEYDKFKDDLAKRFPNVKIEVIKADEIDIESSTLRKADIP